jgi:hypothetical protein
MFRSAPACVAVVLLIVTPTSATAFHNEVWAWLAQLSGPGPFSGAMALATACVQDQRLKASPIGADSDDHKNLSDRSASHTHPELFCVFVDQGFFSSPADAARGYPELRAHMTDVGLSVRLIDGLDLGAGVGWLSFRGDRIPATTRKLTLTPVRIVIRPLLLALPEEIRRPWLGGLSFYWKQVYIPGRIQGREFGQIPPDGLAPFSGPAEAVESFGFALDATALLRFFR